MIYIYIPTDPDGASHRRIEAAGCEVVLGDPTWRSRRGGGRRWQRAAQGQNVVWASEAVLTAARA